MKVEWSYIALVCLATVMFFTMRSGFQGLDPIYAIFLLTGLIITFGVFAIPTVEMTHLGKPENFLFQTGLGNLIVGVVALKGIPEGIILTPTSTYIAITVEEIYRVGSALLIFEALKAGASISSVMSAIVFAAMHMYWNPAGWIYAMIGGFAWSFLLFIYGSQTACVVTHFMFDLLMFRHISVLHYFIISILMLLVFLVKRPTVRWEEI